MNSPRPGCGEGDRAEGRGEGFALNEQVAENLREAARVLEAQGAVGFRVQAYRRAAGTVDGLAEDLSTLLDREGARGLTDLPYIGRGIAAAIAEMIAHGRWSRLDRLRGELDPVRLFQCIPGVGPRLAGRICETLHVDTLEALEAAAHDGRLEAVCGVGPRRAASVRNALAATLARVRPTPRAATHRPPVPLLLAVDEDYRRAARDGRLPTIAPKRFNPEGRSWLPIMHSENEGWHFTALYSNSALAHDTGHTHDWVVLYFYDEQHREGQCTVVTERRGPLAGRRVVRGRESECLEHYADAGSGT